tara:strand:+ start:447 stop:1010 length:564 start_codon:yes stop_codon:yes gene_type:complete
MIRSLSGTIQSVGEGFVVVDVHGVGHQVACLTGAPLSAGQSILLHTHLAVRETALDLYGFLEEAELEMFELLLGVPKVGPKSALQILNQATPKLLIEAAQKNDAAYLHKLSGIGKKTCENVIQFMQSKLEILPETDEDTTLNDTETDAIDALIALGYEQSAARDVVRSLSGVDATVNSLVRDALKQL